MHRHSTVLRLAIGMMSLYLLNSCASQDPFLRKARSTSHSNPAQALRNYSIAIRHDPKNTRTAEEGSAVALRYGRPDSVVQWLLIDAEGNKGLSDRALLYLADAYLINSKPQKAIPLLKQLLRKEKLADSLRLRAEQLLIWAENALWAMEAPPAALIQPLDSPANSPFDEWGSILSPYTLRWYFTRARPPQALRHKPKPTNRLYAILYSAGDHKHQQSVVQPLTPYFDYQAQWLALLDIAADGTALWYYKGHTPRQGAIYRLPYDQLQDSVHSTMGTHPPGFHAQKGLSVIGDSLIIYASDIPEGYGGYDLYMMRKQGDQWSKPINLGPPINTPMDEITPYYHAKSGQLYFSSNRRESYGHLDVFRVDFDARQSSWGAVQHLAMPVNSTADDLYFRLYDDGLTASLTSNRPSAFGGLDLYKILFNEPQFAVEQPPIIPLFVARAAPTDSLPMPQGDKPSATQNTLSLVPVPLKSTNIVSDSPFVAQLNTLTILLQRYPHTRIYVRSYVYSQDYEVDNQRRSFEIAERIREYLNERGIPDSSIITQGFGSRHLHKDKPPSQSSTEPDTAVALIEWYLYPPPTEVAMSHDNGATPIDQMSQPYFKIALPPHTQDAHLARLVHASNYGLIERIGNTPKPDALIGMFHSYESARSWLKKLQSLYPKYPSRWKILPYFKGRRLTQHEIVLLKEQFPELNVYFTRHLRAR